MNPQQPHVIGGRVVLLPDPPPTTVEFPHATPVGAGWIMDVVAYRWNGSGYVLEPNP